MRHRAQQPDVTELLPKATWLLNRSVQIYVSAHLKKQFFLCEGAKAVKSNFSDTLETLFRDITSDYILALKSLAEKVEMSLVLPSMDDFILIFYQ